GRRRRRPPRAPRSSARRPAARRTARSWPARGEPPVELEQALGELAHVGQHGVAPGAEHARQVARALAVDGEAEDVEPEQARLDDGLAHVLDAVAPLVLVL